MKRPGCRSIHVHIRLNCNTCLSLVKFIDKISEHSVYLAVKCPENRWDAEKLEHPLAYNNLIVPKECHIDCHSKGVRGIIVLYLAGHGEGIDILHESLIGF